MVTAAQPICAASSSRVRSSALRRCRTQAPNENSSLMNLSLPACERRSKGRRHPVRGVRPLGQHRPRIPSSIMWCLELDHFLRQAYTPWHNANRFALARWFHWAARNCRDGAEDIELRHAEISNAGSACDLANQRTLHERVRGVHVLEECDPAGFVRGFVE